MPKLYEKEKPVKHRCDRCGTTYDNENQFCSSKHVMYRYSNGRTRTCLTCIKTMFIGYIEAFNGDRNYALKVMCSKFGWYYDEEVFSGPNGCDNGKENAITVYVARMNTGKCKWNTWEDNLMGEYKREKKTANDIIEIVKPLLISADEISPEIISNWGTNFEPHEYVKLENLYNELAKSNSHMTKNPQDVDYLRKICFSSVLLDRAYVEGEEKKIQALTNAYSKMMQDSKLRIIDKSDNKDEDDVLYHGNIFAEAEKENFIPPWEKYSKIYGLKQDILDKTIMYMLNFILKLNKADKMVIPPSDTPKAEMKEIDKLATVSKSYELDDEDDLPSGYDDDEEGDFDYDE